MLHRLRTVFLPPPLPTVGVASAHSCMAGSLTMLSHQGPRHPACQTRHQTVPSNGFYKKNLTDFVWKDLLKYPNHLGRLVFSMPNRSVLDLRSFMKHDPIALTCQVEPCRPYCQMFLPQPRGRLMQKNVYRHAVQSRMRQEPRERLRQVRPTVSNSRLRSALVLVPWHAGVCSPFKHEQALIQDFAAVGTVEAGLEHDGGIDGSRTGAVHF